MQLPVLGCTFLTLSERIGTDDQCPDDRCPAVLPVSATYQCTHLCHPAVPHTCAQKCHPPVPTSAAQQCCQSVPSSCASQCLAVLPVSATYQ
ncbi:unnamed protein product, partial [Staurois parvus]